MTLTIPALTEYRKKVSANLDYDFDFANFLGSDTVDIGSTTVTATPSGLTLGSKSTADGKVKQWISGGDIAQTYTVTCELHTGAGRIQPLSFLLHVTDDGA